MLEHTEKILAEARKAAEDNGMVFPDSREQAKKHKIGDTLMDFIYLELHETLEDDDHFESWGDEEIASYAIGILIQAQEDIQKIIDGIDDACQKTGG